MLLTAGDEQLSSELTGRFTYAWAGLLILALGWGLGSAGIWAVAWKLFGEPVGRLMPAVAVAVVFGLWLFRRALTGMAEILFASSSTGRSMIVSSFILILTVTLLSLQPDYYRADSPLPAIISWFRPWVKIYRVLILMPLWGIWATLVTPQFCRPTAETEPALVAFSRGCGPLAVTAVMGLLLAVTITYFNFLPWEQLAVSAVTVFGAITAGVIFCRLTGGLTRKAMLAANVLTQLIFALAYLATRNLLIW